MTDVASPGSLGYGQQDPNDASSEYNKVAFAVRQITSRLNTMKLVKIMAVHGGGGAIAAPGTVDVQPLVNQIDGQGNSQSHGTVFAIPVWRLQGGNFAVICDPAVDDIGYVIVSDRDISNVKSTQAQANPGSFRKFDLADGVYVGGLLNGAPDSGVFFDFDQNGGIKIVDGNGNIVILTSSGISVTDTNGNKLQSSGSGWTLTGNLSVTGTITATGNITAGSIDLETHVHTGVTSGSSSTGPPVG